MECLERLELSLCHRAPLQPHCQLWGVLWAGRGRMGVGSRRIGEGISGEGGRDPGAVTRARVQSPKQPLGCRLSLLLQAAPGGPSKPRGGLEACAEVRKKAFHLLPVHAHTHTQSAGAFWEQQVPEAGQGRAGQGCQQAGGRSCCTRGLTQSDLGRHSTHNSRR